MLHPICQADREDMVGTDWQADVEEKRHAVDGEDHLNLQPRAGTTRCRSGCTVHQRLLNLCCSERFRRRGVQAAAFPCTALHCTGTSRHSAMGWVARVDILQRNYEKLTTTSRWLPMTTVVWWRTSLSRCYEHFLLASHSQQYHGGFFHSSSHVYTLCSGCAKC